MKWQNKELPPITLEESLKRFRKRLEEEPVHRRDYNLIMSPAQHAWVCGELKQIEEIGYAEYCKRIREEKEADD